MEYVARIMHILTARYLLCSARPDLAPADDLLFSSPLHGAQRDARTRRHRPGTSALAFIDILIALTIALIVRKTSPSRSGAAPGGPGAAALLSTLCWRAWRLWHLPLLLLIGADLFASAI